MGVLAEAISVVIPVATLEAKFPGGAAAYAASAPNSSFCSDGDLTRIGFMVPEDVQVFVESLYRLGLRYIADKHCVEIAVVDQFRGPMAPCSWLEFGRHPEGFGVVWLKGTEPSPMYAPDHWSASQSALLTAEAVDAVGERLLPLARDGALDVYLDFRTGKEAYIGRVRGSQSHPESSGQ